MMYRNLLEWRNPPHLSGVFGDLRWIVFQISCAGLLELRWSDLIARIRSFLPRQPDGLRNEDTLIWAQLIRELVQASILQKSLAALIWLQRNHERGRHVRLRHPSQGQPTPQTEQESGGRLENTRLKKKSRMRSIFPAGPKRPLPTDRELRRRRLPDCMAGVNFTGSLACQKKSRRFMQCDGPSTTPMGGNGLVVLDGADRHEAMQRLPDQFGRNHVRLLRPAIRPPTTHYLHFQCRANCPLRVIRTLGTATPLVEHQTSWRHPEVNAVSWSTLT
jgi:hypothetical protein